MNEHKEFCKKLGNTSYTRLKYTEEDRELRRKLEEAIKEEKARKDKGTTGVALYEQNQALKTFNKMSKGRFGKFTDNSER